MKKLLKNKYFIVAVALIVLGGGAFAAVKSKQKVQKQNEEKKAKEQKKQDETGKQDNPPKESSDAYKSQGGTTTIQSNMGALSDVSLTVYLNRQQSTSQDGKTTIPTNSISPYFYLPSGVYSVQKMVNGVWQDVATNINYPGHGGLSVPVIGPGEDNVSYRALKTENGVAKSVSKTFVVKRSDLAGGVYTYN